MVLLLGSNQIVDISPLSNLINLKSLDLSSNEIADASVLSGLINLKSLDLSSNEIVDIQALVDNSGLASGDTVNIRSNYLDLPSVVRLDQRYDSPDMRGIEALENRGVDVRY